MNPACSSVLSARWTTSRTEPTSEAISSCVYSGDRWVAFGCFGTLVDWQAWLRAILAPFADDGLQDFLRTYLAQCSTDDEYFSELKGDRSEELKNTRQISRYKLRSAKS